MADEKSHFYSGFQDLRPQGFFTVERKYNFVSNSLQLEFFGVAG